MSRFYATVKSEKKSLATKCGVSKLEAHVRSWDHGIKVNYWVDEDGQTLCQVFLTGGSDKPDTMKLIKAFIVGKTENRRPGASHYGRPVGGS
jgi:hypothetical protein